MALMKIAKLDCCVEILDFQSNPFRIIMEYCEGGDLRNLLNQKKLPLEDKLVITSQILSAIERIHKLGVIHGDLKCANIFLVNKYIPGNYGNIKVKIGDFGLSEIGGNLVLGGTPGFVAPEVFKSGGSFSSDIYSIGKVMLEIMTQLPLQVISAIHINNIHLIKQYLPNILNGNLYYSLVRPCLEFDPKKRPCAAQVNKGFRTESRALITVAWKIAANLRPKSANYNYKK